ncbi:hypothetical protein GCM10009525_09880 [Streptosporangium amethystogenes subsp. fukuiense]
MSLQQSQGLISDTPHVDQQWPRGHLQVAGRDALEVSVEALDRRGAGVTVFGLAENEVGFPGVER